MSIGISSSLNEDFNSQKAYIVLHQPYPDLFRADGPFTQIEASSFKHTYGGEILLLGNDQYIKLTALNSQN